MRRTLLLPLLFTLLPSLGPSQPAAWDTEVNLPPLFGLDSAEDGAHRGYVLWPLIHWRREGTVREWGLRPLFNLRRDPARDQIKIDLIWPLISWDRDETNLDWRAFPVMSGWSLNQRRGDPYRYFRIFPLVFFDRSPQQFRHVVFPFMHVREGLERDGTSFFGLLPWFRLTRESTGEDYVSLFPVGWEKIGDDLTGFALLPLYIHRWGQEPTLLAVPPLWFDYHDSDELGRTHRRVRSLLGPLFVSDQDADKRRQTVSVLWPLIAWGDGEDYALRRFLPLYSHETQLESGPDLLNVDRFVFPVMVSTHREHGELYSRRITGPLFWWWWGPDAGEQRRDTWGLYPLVNGSLEEGGLRDISIFDPLFFLDDTEVHDQLAPLWRLFHHREDFVESEEETEILWRLFHRERRGSSTETHLFPVTVERAPDWRREALLWRLLEQTQDPSGRYLRIFFSPRIRIGDGLGDASGAGDEVSSAQR